MGRGSSDSVRRLGLIAVAAALAAALGAVGARMARRDERGRGADLHRCACGALYRVSGADRHRVYWPADAPDSEPVLGDRCVRCDAPLPAEHETTLG